MELKGIKHHFICGQTRSGKTYTTIKELNSFEGGVLFWNVQEEDVPKGWVALTPLDVSANTIYKALSKGKKISIQMSLDTKSRNVVYLHVVNLLLERRFRKPVVVVFDECHLLEKESLKAAILVATVGLSRGVVGYFITQRPSNADKTLLTQSDIVSIFRTSLTESQYFKQKGINLDVIMKENLRNGEFSHCETDGFELKFFDKKNKLKKTVNLFDS